MSTTEAKQKAVVISRASSRRELASLVLNTILPLLQTHGHNLEVAKHKITELETKIAALEMRLEPR